MADNFRIVTPHAAVLVWNYIDRFGIPTGAFDATGVKDQNTTENETKPVIISTLSCVSIQTSKSKGVPEGNFNLVLAPYKNWTSTLTAGSWCAILMSNEPITEDDLKLANPKQVKMLGRIETVRTETNVDDEGARHTLYYVSGVDWGNIFSSQLYIDNLVDQQNDPQSLGSNTAVAIQKLLFGASGGPAVNPVRINLAGLLDVMGKNLDGYDKLEPLVGRLSKGTYDLTLPKPVVDFMNFDTPTGEPTDQITKLLNLQTGSLIKPETYHDFEESLGYVDSFSLQGSHSFWQVLMENSAPVLNEMFCEMTWTSDGQPALMLYNRIKPFSYQGALVAAGDGNNMRSYFQYLPAHDIATVDVMSVNVGTNWRDKFNFVEIRPTQAEFEIYSNWIKAKSQAFDREAFKREGLRSMILDTRQFPSAMKKGDTGLGIDWDKLRDWCGMLREWFFGTHRLLNGTIVLHGTSEYIEVGNNIRFNAALVNPNYNINYETKKNNKQPLIMAHVESVSHAFTVSPDGARSYTTTIQFVRGITVNPDGSLYGEGMLDQDASKLTQKDDRNQRNVISSSVEDDPDPQKIEGT